MINIRSAEKIEYVDFCNQHQASLLQSFDYGSWQEHLGKKIERLAMEQDGQTISVYTEITEAIRHNLTYKYIPHGPVASKNNIDIVLQNILAKQNQKNIYTLIEPTTEHASTNKTNERKQPASTLVLDISLSTEELLKQMHQKTRYNIKLSQKQNLSTEHNNIKHLSLIEDTAKRAGYTNHNLSYYQKMFDFFQHTSQVKSQIISILKDNTPIACGLFIDYLNTRYYIAGGSDYNHRNLMAPYLLHTTSIQNAKENNITKYDFWGLETISGKTPGFAKFKEGFGGQKIMYPKCIQKVHKPITYSLLSLYRNLKRLI